MIVSALIPHFGPGLSGRGDGGGACPVRPSGTGAPAARSPRFRLEIHRAGADPLVHTSVRPFGAFSVGDPIVVAEAGHPDTPAVYTGLRIVEIWHRHDASADTVLLHTVPLTRSR